MQRYAILLGIELRSLCATIPGNQHLEFVLEVMAEQATVVQMQPVEGEHIVWILVVKVPEYVLVGCYY
jgi:hypothetical protein